MEGKLYFLQQAVVEQDELREYCASLEHSMGAFLADIAEFQAFYTQVLAATPTIIKLLSIENIIDNQKIHPAR